MSCDELRDAYELHAMGLSEEAEGAELREHLHRGCTTCTSGVRTARELVAMLAGTAPAAAPSPKLRRRILASVGMEQRSWGFMPLWIAVSALCLVVAVYFYGRERDTAGVMARFQEQARRQAIELAQLNDALALLNQPETKQVIFGEGAPQPPRGRVFVHPASGVLLLASHLPPAPAGKIYEMWVIPKGGKPAPAGLFQSDQAGMAMHLYKGPVDVALTAAVAVTLEPGGGVPQPTSQPLIVAAL